MSITAKTALNRSTEKFHIYLQESGKLDEFKRPERYLLVMPDEDGTFPDFVMARKTGIILSWPVNPHSTGETGILQLLNGAYRHGIVKPVECNGFGCDQDGRYFKR